MTDSLTFLVADLDPAARPVWTGPVPAELERAVDAAAAAHGGTRTAGRPGEGQVAAFAAATAIRRAASDDLARQLRVAVHTGAARVRSDGRYAGAALRRAQRLREIASGGQVVVSAATASLADDAGLRDRGIHRLRDLSRPERVFELPPPQDGDPVPLRSLDSAPHNLPVQPTSFVGRRAELAELHRLLAHERAVTVVGPGGAGKTRLAVHALAEQIGRWPDGVWWVDLGGVTEDAAVGEEVAAAVGVLVEPVQGPLASLTRQLRDRRLLVCLDNCEQVLDGAAEVVHSLLEACPEIGVVATSREPLGVAGELVWGVPSLAEDDALWLFLERGSQVSPSFALDDTNEEVLRTLCARLDGMPLALELAAAWVRTLSPREIESGLDDRFGLLVRGARDAAGRQKTLAASIAWSHDLLEDRDRAVFRSLGVFPGSFDLAAARAVCPEPGEVLAALGRLVDKSLVVAEPHGGATRYRLLESIREYAAERLDEAGGTAAARERHLGHFLALAEAAAPLLDTDKERWRVLIQRDADNLRAALEWGLAAEDPEPGRRLAAELPWLWHLDRHGPLGIELLQRAVLLAPDDRSLLQGRLLMGIALVADTAAPLGLEYDIAQQALEIATEHGDERLRAMALALAAVGRFYVDLDGAWRLAERAVQAAERADDEFTLAASPGLQAIILHLRDRHAEAEAIFAVSIPALLDRGDRGVASTLLTFQAHGALAVGEPDRAQALAERAVAVADPLADYHRVGMARSTLAFVLACRGRFAEGAELLGGFVTLVEGAGREVFVPGLARGLGMLASWSGRVEEARRWLEQEAGWTGEPAGTYVEAQALPALAGTLRRLGRLEEARAAADRALELAATLDMPRVVAQALDEQARLSGPDAALELHHRALGIRAEHGLRWGYAHSLEALAALGGPPEHAVRLLAAAERARRDLGCPRPPVDDPAHETLVEGLRDTPGFDAEWAAGEALEPDEAVGYARRSRGTRDRPLSGWASLTPAERDVVRLAVEGLSNPDIGARLFMSRHTVKTHLSHVYAKLGVANRTELAAFASKASLG